MELSQVVTEFSLETNTKESLGRDSGGLPGSKSMACIERNSRNLGDPVAPT